MNDNISDLFTRIRNANLIKKKKIIVPYNKINECIIKILVQHGFVHSFQKIHIKNKNNSILKLKKNVLQLNLNYKDNKPVILQIKRLSKPGCRLYVKSKEIPQYYGNLGIVFLSTSKGIISDREARLLNVGGEILGFVA